MNKLLIWCYVLFMSCTSTPSQSSQKLQDMQAKAEILVSESQGGADQLGFTIIKDEQEFQKIIKGNLRLLEIGKGPDEKYPPFPKDKKVILYNLGTFRSGDHRITQIKGLSVKDNVLYVEVPEYISGGMEIQAISNPWMIFTVPSGYQFNSVKLKYSK